MSTSFPEIPVMEADAVQSMNLAPERLDGLVSRAEAHYGHRALKIGDAITRKWLEKAANPFRAEIDTVSRTLGRPGAIMLNLSYEWACTSGICQTSGYPVLKRTLDWPLAGLGETVIVAKRSGPAGAYLDITWPGLVGMLTGLARGRFACVINQPPAPFMTGNCWIDWGLTRVGLWRRRALPATHLLRQVFEGCGTYAEAKRVLTNTPLALPAFFTLAGTEPGELCVIERREETFAVHEGEDAVACANHYRKLLGRGHSRGNLSEDRLTRMTEILTAPAQGLGWVAEPILNATTRLACTLCPRTGEIEVQGFEKETKESAGPATQPLKLVA